MEENKTEEKEEFKTISLKKYVWPDEAKFRAEQSKNKKLKRIMVVVTIVAVLFGWLGGSLLPYGFTSSLRNMIARGTTMSGATATWWCVCWSTCTPWTRRTPS